MKNFFGGTIGCFIFVILFNLLVGAWSVDKILSWFNISMPGIVDALIGLFVAEFSVPIAIVGSILKAFGAF